MSNESTSRTLIQTPSQTVGPFFGYALPYAGGSDLVPGHHPQAIRLHGTVIDGAGNHIPDAILEIWQADASGSPVHERGSLDRDGFTFTGFGRTPVTLGGHYTFTTVKPGAVGSAAPYILVTVFARGLTHHLFTRVYFPEDGELHQRDTVLGTIVADRRGTLIAVADGPVGGVPSYRFDIRMQGEGETVFFDFDSANGIGPADHA
ncbi:protocatechuate 3,4-dioxygenase subunit alpha [Leifsonia sp. A12D58]|uniref:protocatechuate 3,4-dioxygenase subunit alpha n=1 Tax=Leifsonia sp. A12D58 TaxID=3397674 RepID=UPI0039E00946